MARLTFRLVLLAPLLVSCSSQWSLVDQDGDGISPAEGDCWDSTDSPAGTSLTGADIHPGAAETWYDGVDQDCGGDNDYDADGDGYVPTAYAAQAPELPSGDCDDNVATVNPAASDEWYDGVDSDCAGNDDYDQDGDGFVATEYQGLQTTYVDGSGSLPGDDCDDTVATVNPDQADTWYDGVDTDCAGNDDYDQDGDGYVPQAYDGLATTYVPGSGNLPPGDCDDTDPMRYPDPSAPVVWYNGIDERCDENDGDQDGDGYWVSDYAERVAASGSGEPPLTIPTGKSGDCFDDAADRPDPKDPSNVLVPINGGTLLDPDQVHPGAADAAYDGVDADCAGDSDFDKDGDGYDSECMVQRDGSTGSDCLDDDDVGSCGEPDPASLGPMSVHPGAEDTWYDGTDANCDNLDDWDADYDHYIPNGYSAVYTGTFGANDCDDGDADVNPGATDTWYDGVDQNCSGNDDYDQDSDRYVPDAYAGLATTYVSGSGSLPSGDCDDTVSTVNPGRVDTWYDGTDTNCSGNDDFDKDSDGYVPDVYAGLATTYVSGSGSLPSGDCNDSDASINPAATEIWYDGVDQDCDGPVRLRRRRRRLRQRRLRRHRLRRHRCGDQPWRRRGLVRRRGPATATAAATTTPTATATTATRYGGTDCDDTDSAVNPGATETWYDGVDQDCGGGSDYDADGDGYDSDAYSGTDCDDTDSAIHPGAVETWYDGMDQDCGGGSDYDADGDGHDIDTHSGGDDCNDADTTVYLGATELADEQDNDCDEYIDEDFVSSGDIIIDEAMINPSSLAATRRTSGSRSTTHRPTPCSWTTGSSTTSSVATSPSSSLLMQPCPLRPATTWSSVTTQPCPM